ncbi:BTB/POZ domain-containing protein At5g03250 [Linum perenne]
MAFLRLGSKSESFHRQGLNWFCNSGLPSDVAIEVGDMCFNLHKFPLISRSGLLSDLIEQLPPEEGSVCSLKLHDLPGGSKAFELAAKFCYGVKFELRASNVVSLRCAAEHLRMTEDYGEKNLILQTENFLKEVFTNWSDSVTALKSCQEILTPTEDLRIVSRCIHSLATKACSESNSNNSSPLEVAPDVNLKLSKFETLAATIPDYARPVDDGLYHAIDVYLKAHPWLTESEKEQLCRLMNCQKLSLEASTHAAQNERLPLRLIIQVLFFEQIRLRTTVSGWFFVTDNMENSQQIDQLQLLKNESSCQVEQEIQAAGNDDGHKMKERVSELQKECLEIKEDIEKLVKAKKGWRLFSKSSRLKQKLQSCNSGKSCDFKDPEPLPIVTSVTNNEQKQNPDASEVSPQNFRFH